MAENQKRDYKELEKYAKLMYLNSQMTQKEICQQLDISEPTMSDWARDGKWKELRTSMLTSNAEQLAQLYKILEKLNESAHESLEDDDPKTNPDTDGIIKITKAIHYLQTKTGTGQMYETGMAFLTFLQKEDPELAKKVAPHFTSFIRQNL